MEDTHETAPGPTAEAIAERQRAVDLLARHIIEALPPGAKLADIALNVVHRADDAMIEREMLAAAERIGKQPFKRGDWITPRAHASYSGKGTRMLVIEKLNEPITVREQGCFQLYDIIVLRMMNGDIAAFHAESWQFEPWVAKPKMDDAAAPS